jgi:hypothetical protein
MTQKPDNLVLEHLRYMRAALDEVRDDVKDLKFRVGVVERGMISVQDTLFQHSAQFDRVNARLAKIEKRLDLVEA